MRQYRRQLMDWKVMIEIKASDADFLAGPQRHIYKSCKSPTVLYVEVHTNREVHTMQPTPKGKVDPSKSTTISPNRLARHLKEPEKISVCNYRTWTRMQ